MTKKIAGKERCYSDKLKIDKRPKIFPNSSTDRQIDQTIDRLISELEAGKYTPAWPHKNN